MSVANDASRSWLKKGIVQDALENGLEFDVASQRHASHVSGVGFLHLFAYIRRSLERALDFSETHEVPLLDNVELQRALAR